MSQPTRQNRTCRIVGIYEAMDAVRIDYGSQSSERAVLLADLRCQLSHAYEDLTTDVYKIVSWYKQNVYTSARATLSEPADDDEASEQAHTETLLNALDETWGI